MNISPLPWHSHEMERGIICDKNGRAILDCDPPSMETEQLNLNQTFILRAVNSHEELLDIARDSHWLLSRRSGHPEKGCDCHIAKAIAAAEAR